MKRLGNLLFVSTLMLLCFSNTLLGQDSGKPLLHKDIKNGAPIVVTAKVMEAQVKKGWLIFRGNVKAVKGDMNLYADWVKVIWVSKKKGIDKILAKGHVKVERGSRVILSDEAKYSVNKGVVEFWGHPKAWEGKNLVLGERMLYYTKEDKSVVIGGEERVNAVIYPEEEKKSATEGTGAGEELQRKKGGKGGVAGGE